MRYLSLLLFPLLVFAQSSSEHYTMTRSVIDAAGQLSASESYTLVGAAGQPTPPGESFSESFTLHAGFLHPLFAVSPLSPIQDLVIKEMQPHVVLRWSTIPGAAHYNIYRDSESLFTPDESNFLGTVADPFFIDEDVIATGSDQNFYIVTSIP